MDFSNALFFYRGQARSHSQSHDQLFLRPDSPLYPHYQYLRARLMCTIPSAAALPGKQLQGGNTRENPNSLYLFDYKNWPDY